MREHQRPEGTALPKTEEASQSKTDEENKAKVPTVRAKLLNSACLLTNWCTPVQVVLVGGSKGDLLADIRGEPALIQHDENGTARILLCESTGFTDRLDGGTILGEAVDVEVMLDMAPASVNVVSGGTNPPFKDVTCRQPKLKAILFDDLRHLSHEEANAIKTEVLQLHAAFVFEDGKRGETDLIRLNIDTDDAQPKKQPAH